MTHSPRTRTHGPAHEHCIRDPVELRRAHISGQTSEQIAELLEAAERDRDRYRHAYDQERQRSAALRKRIERVREEL